MSSGCEKKKVGFSKPFISKASEVCILFLVWLFAGGDKKHKLYRSISLSCCYVSSSVLLLSFHFVFLFSFFFIFPVSSLSSYLLQPYFFLILLSLNRSFIFLTYPLLSVLHFRLHFVLLSHFFFRTALSYPVIMKAHTY